MVVVSRVLSIFILVVIGYVARKSKVIDKSLIKGISGLVLNVSIPFTIIAGFDRNIPRSAMPDLVSVALWAIGIHLSLIAVSSLVYRRMESGSRKVLSYMSVFSNCGFMGFPVVESVFGKVGVMYASIYVVVFQVFIWTYGVTIFSGTTAKGQFRKALLNPGTFSVLIGLVVWLIPFDLPQALSTSISTMSMLTTPLSMMIVGATLADVPMAGLFGGWALWIGTAARLIAIPLAVFGFMKLTGAHSLPAQIAAFLTSMPAAAQSVIFAERYGADVHLASRMVFVTTVLSALTIPVFALLVG